MLEKTAPHPRDRLAGLKVALSRQSIRIPRHGSWPESGHQFDTQANLAILTAVAAGRPLLVRGEPGIGKSQIARAAATAMEVPFLPFVINATCECNDLLFTYDAVSRLAEAQMSCMKREQDTLWKLRLDEHRFIKPQVLWWAIDWKGALDQQREFYEHNPTRALTPETPPGWEPGQGVVVLIDEIDKADSDLPNGLLESLSNTGFQIPQGGRGVALPANHLPPLVVITTNEERELPAAFLRRCVVLNLPFPDKEPEQLDFLIKRGRVQFASDISDAVLEGAARQVINDRKQVPPGQPRPGAAEYIDLLRVLADMAGDESGRLRLLTDIAPFVLCKHQLEPTR